MFTKTKYLLKEMEVSSLETSTELDVLEIQYSRENQPRLTKRWSTVSNLAEQSGNEDIFELLDFYDILYGRVRINGKKTLARRVTFAEKVVVIRF